MVRIGKLVGLSPADIIGHGRTGHGRTGPDRSRLIGEGFESEVYRLTADEVQRLEKNTEIVIDVLPRRSREPLRGKWFAVKIDHGHLKTDEAQIQLHINQCSPGLSPKLVWSGIIDDGVRKEKRITVMEYVKILPMDERAMRAYKPLIIDALRRLKACGVKHNDLHGNNIALVQDGASKKIMIIDYGLSKRINPISSNIYDKFKNSNYDLLFDRRRFKRSWEM